MILTKQEISINQTGIINTSGQIFTNAKISAGNSRPNSPSKTLHISSSINGDGIRVQGPNNPLIQASNDTGVIYSIGAITSANTQLTGSVAGDTTFRYANDMITLMVDYYLVVVVLLPQF